MERSTSAPPTRSNNLAFFDPHQKPMRLCTACKKLDMSLFIKLAEELSEHHEFGSFSSIRASASAGCDLCCVLSDAVIDECARQKKCSFKEAEAALGSNDNRPCRMKHDTLLNKFLFLAPYGQDWSEASRAYFSLRAMPRKTSSPVPFMPFATFRRHLFSGPSACFETRARELEVIPDPNLGIGRDWIQQCLRNHANCTYRYKKKDRLKMPTRVIDVGPADGGQAPHLHISERTFGTYVALSHCWGSSRPLMTTKNTIDQHLRGLDMDQLPLTFKDAILATRNLGYRYLWIDSLW